MKHLTPYKIFKAQNSDRFVNVLEYNRLLSVFLR